jgi:hypothetical protein
MAGDAAKQTLAQAQRKLTSSAVPPLAFRFSVDFVCSRSEGRQGAHTRPVEVMLHALAACILLQQRKFMRRCAEEKPVIHVVRSENKTSKGHASVTCVVWRRCLSYKMTETQTCATSSTTTILGGAFSGHLCTYQKLEQPQRRCRKYRGPTRP